MKSYLTLLMKFFKINYLSVNLKNFFYKIFMIFSYFVQEKKFKISQIKKNNSIRKDCVVLGNGPSLKMVLQNNDSFFSSKDIYVVNDFSLSPYFSFLKPNFYVIIDPAYWFPDRLSELKRKSLLNISNVTWRINLILPIDAKRNLHNLFVTNSLISIFYFPNVFFCNFSNFPIFYKSSFFNPRIQNVLVYTLFLAINNNHKNIFLLGAEHSWLNALFVNDENVVCAIDNHFYENRVKLEPYLTCFGEKYKLHELLYDFGKMFQGYHELEVYSKRLNVSIFNCSKDSFIDAFVRKSI